MTTTITEMVIRELKRKNTERLEEELSFLDLFLSPEVVATYFHLSLTPIILWVSWEYRCRDRGEREKTGSECGDRKATRFNSSIREIVFKASIDLAPPWLLSSWVLRHLKYTGMDAVDLDKNGLAGIVAKAISYPAYLALISGATKSIIDSTSRMHYEHANITASYIYWEIVYPLYDYTLRVLAKDPVFVGIAKGTKYLESIASYYFYEKVLTKIFNTKIDSHVLSNAMKQFRKKVLIELRDFTDTAKKIVLSSLTRFVWRLEHSMRTRENNT